MGFFKSFSSKPKSKDIAKERLKFILIHDRGNLPEETLDKIKTEILEVLAKYIDIQEDDVDISVSTSEIETGDNGSALIANIPIKSIRGQ